MAKWKQCCNNPWMYAYLLVDLGCNVRGSCCVRRGGLWSGGSLVLERIRRRTWPLIDKGIFQKAYFSSGFVFKRTKMYNQGGERGGVNSNDPTRMHIYNHLKISEILRIANFPQKGLQKPPTHRPIMGSPSTPPQPANKEIHPGTVLGGGGEGGGWWCQEWLRIH